MARSSQDRLVQPSLHAHAPLHSVAIYSRPQRSFSFLPRFESFSFFLIHILFVFMNSFLFRKRNELRVEKLTSGGWYSKRYFYSALTSDVNILCNLSEIKQCFYFFKLLLFFLEGVVKRSIQSRMCVEISNNFFQIEKKYQQLGSRL